MTRESISLCQVCTCDAREEHCGHYFPLNWPDKLKSLNLAPLEHWNGLSLLDMVWVIQPSAVSVSSIYLNSFIDLNSSQLNYCLQLFTSKTSGTWMWIIGRIFFVRHYFLSFSKRWQWLRLSIGMLSLLRWLHSEKQYRRRNYTVACVPEFQ